MKSSNKKLPPKVIGTSKDTNNKSTAFSQFVPILDRKSSYVKVKSKSE